MKLNYLAAALLSASLSVPALAATVATVNGKTIDSSLVDSEVKALVSAGATDSPALREDIKNSLVNRELMLQEARRRGLDKTPDYQQRVKNFPDQLLQESLLADIFKKNPVTDSQAKAAYDKIVANYKGTKGYVARQIVVKSESEAKQIIADLKKGQNFEQLARNKSIDPAAKQTGGLVLPSPLPEKDLTAANPGLNNTLKALGKGGYSQTPIQQGNVWIVLKVDDVADVKIDSYEQMKPRLMQQLAQENVAKTLKDLRDKAKIQ